MLKTAVVLYISFGTNLNQVSYDSFAIKGLESVSKTCITCVLKSQLLFIASSIILAIFPLNIDKVGLMIYVIGIFFPATKILGLSLHSKSSIFEVVFSFQLAKLALLLKVMVPFKFISLASFKPINSVPYFNFAQIFKGITETISPFFSINLISEVFQIFISVLSSFKMVSA